MAKSAKLVNVSSKLYDIVERGAQEPLGKVRVRYNITQQSECSEEE